MHGRMWRGILIARLLGASRGIVMRLALSIVFCVLLLGHAGIAAAQAPAGWIADRKTGCKVWNAEPRPKETIAWDGPCKGGIANGRGTLQWFENGKLAMRQEGELRNGRLEGRGLSIDADGTRDEAEYVDGKANGRGITTYADGTRVVGTFVDGKMEGRGVVTTPDGQKIDADFENDEAVRGVWIGIRGGRYEGELKDFKMHGRGKLQLSDGSLYDGEFANNQYEGDGTFLRANGNRYDGEWSNGLPNGRGTSRIDGRQNSGLWEDGCLAEEDSDFGFWSVFMNSAADCGFE